MSNRTISVLSLLLLVAGCASPNQAGGPNTANVRQDPDTAPVVKVDRFSDQAGTFFRRSGNDQLPGGDEPIDLDQAPFVFTAFAPDGSRVTLHDLDVHPSVPANLYVFFNQDGSPVGDQLYVFDALPGEPGYNDFCVIQRVTVPAGYVADSITSRKDLEARMSEGFKVERSNRILDMPVVPSGSKARTSQGQALLLRGWCNNQVLYYFAFDEIQATAEGLVPTAPMYAFFSEEGQPHQAGFRTIDDQGNTRNVLGALPGQTGYSPLWALQRLAREDFINVNSLSDVQTNLKTPPVAYGSAINAVVVH